MKSLLVLSLLALTAYTAPNEDCWSCEMTTGKDWVDNACGDGVANAVADAAATCYSSTWALD